MQYLLMIYRNEAELRQNGSRRARKEMTRGIRRVHAVHRPERPFQGRRRFAADDDGDHGTRSRRQTLTTDGPFAETREQLAGYYLVEAKDLDAASAIAARIPGAKKGSIEVRPVMVYE